MKVLCSLFVIGHIFSSPCRNIPVLVGCIGSFDADNPFDEILLLLISILPSSLWGPALICSNAANNFCILISPLGEAVAVLVSFL
jgi:hypothetical protein